METLTARKKLNGTTVVQMEEYFDDIEVVSLYSWIDRIPLSRPKKNISKDFSDGVLLAEIIHHYFPKMVDLHNYAPSKATRQCHENYMLLNRRVLQKLELELSDDVIRALVHAKPKVVERVLMLLRIQIDKLLEKTGRDAIWRRRELYYHNPDPVLRLGLKTPPSRPTTPPGLKSPRNGDASQRSLTPTRQTKSEPTANSPRKYKPNEVPHGHPDRTPSRLSRGLLHYYYEPQPYSEQRRDTKSDVMLAPRGSDLKLDLLPSARGSEFLSNRSFTSPNKRREPKPEYLPMPRRDPKPPEYLPMPRRMKHVNGMPYVTDSSSYFADKPLPLLGKPFLPPVTDNISRIMYEEKDMECQAKEETIQILNAKIRRLEHLLHLKDVRIEDLHSTLQHTVGLTYSTRKR